LGDDHDRERFLRRLAESVEAYGIRRKTISIASERVGWQSELWVDDVALGHCDSLSAPLRDRLPEARSASADIKD